MKIQLALTGGAVLLALTLSAYAHHPFSAEYDWTKPVTLTGTVNKLELTNPHSHLYIEAKGNDGTMRQWTLEMGSPSALTQAGWTRNTVKKGDSITAEVWLARDKSDKGNVKSVKLADGRELSGASSISEIKKSKTKPISN